MKEKTDQSRVITLDSRAIARKYARLQQGKKPRILDLFSGCGGISLGFKAAGFEIAAAVENDVHAAKSHGMNFHPGDQKHWKARDLTRVNPAALSGELGLGGAAFAFDVIVGGPPCQAFARVGRSKLREVADHPEAFRHDPRARLYIEYLEYVDACAPLAVVMENVPDMLNHGGHNIAEEVSEVLEARGYVCGYTLLNAAHFGVPQMRERMFLVAYHRILKRSVEFPAPTTWISLPAGYDGSRAVALRLLGDKAGAAARYKERYVPNESLPAAVTAQDAIGDLPAIDARKLLATGQLKRGARKFDLPMQYDRRRSVSDFAKHMRSWPGYEASAALKDHVIRYLPRDYELFSRLQPGDQYPEAVQCAEKMFDDLLQKRRAKGEALRAGSAGWTALRDTVVPPYDPSKFPNKWRKMEADKPARTLMAHLGKDTYSHIHYDSAQARPISVREAARLQSFPDGFSFAGTMNPAFRQIGNAVPPLLARAVAYEIAKALGSIQPVFTTVEESA